MAKANVYLDALDLENLEKSEVCEVLNELAERGGRGMNPVYCRKNGAFVLVSNRPITKAVVDEYFGDTDDSGGPR